MKLPYLKWYFRDLSDLRLLDPATRCVWYEMLWLMAGNSRRGYLERQGRPMTPEEIAAAAALPLETVIEAIPKLLADGIPGIEQGTGIWYSRRMAADAHKAELCSAAGRDGGGSPLLTTSPHSLDPETRTQNPYKPKGRLYRSPIKVAPVYPPEFETWWGIYRVLGNPGGKLAALRAWQQLPEDDRIALPERTRAYIGRRAGASSRGVHIPFAPHGSTFINGRRWDDVFAADITDTERGKR